MKNEPLICRLSMAHFFFCDFANRAKKKKELVSMLD